MKPHVTCHMVSSVDGRILSAKWPFRNAGKLFERTAGTIEADAWIVGRTTMQEFSSESKRKRRGRFAVPKTDFVGEYDAKTFAVVIDPSGKCRWNSNMTSTEHVIEVLTEQVTGEYLDHLRSKNVSYVFGGGRELNLKVVLNKLSRLFPIRRVRVDGGGNVNGSFLAAGLIDEFSHVVVPVADGSMGSPAVFDVRPDLRGADGRATALRLKSVTRLRGGVLWCRYAVLNSR